MKRLIPLFAAVLLSVSLCACSTMSAKYEITTLDGQTYITPENPQYNVKTDTYKFLDQSGNEVTLRKEEIRTIKEK